MTTNSNIKLVKNSLTHTPFVYSNGDIPPSPKLKLFHASDTMKLYNNDCLDVINCLENDSIDLVVTSPPYNVDLGKNKYNKNSYDVYNDNKEHSAYITWLKTIFQSLYPKLKVGARVCINIGDGKNGKIPTHSDIIQFMTHGLGYLPYTTIIWNKSQVGNRLAWGSWMSPSSPSFPKPFEYILIFAKESYKLQAKGETDLQRDEFIQSAFAYWDIQPETQMHRIGHPAMYPRAIPYKLIKMLSWKNSTVFDPFNGAGTTGLVCKQLGREYIGAEISEDYCQISVDRWKAVKKAA